MAEQNSEGMMVITGEEVAHIYEQQRFLIEYSEGQHFSSGRWLCRATQGQDMDDPAECTTKPGLIHANACDAHHRNSLFPL